MVVGGGARSEKKNEEKFYKMHISGMMARVLKPKEKQLNHTFVPYFGSILIGEYKKEEKSSLSCLRSEEREN